jgi:hypothetical protein
MPTENLKLPTHPPNLELAFCDHAKRKVKKMDFINQKIICIPIMLRVVQ